MLNELMNNWLKNKLLSARFEIGTHLSKRPLIFFGWRKLFMPNTNHLLISDKTEMVIEGFPRSGNTFAVAAFTIAQNRPIVLARHTHRSAQVIAAIQKNIPTLIVIRHPLDSVLSLTIRHPYISLQQGFRNYIHFYQQIHPYRHGFVIAKFDDIITDFGQSIEAVNRKFHTSFLHFVHNEENVKRCFRIIEEMNCTYIGTPTVREMAVSRPSPHRKEKIINLKKMLQNDIKLKHSLHNAEHQYFNFISEY